MTSFIDELSIAALLSHKVGQSGDSEIDMCVAASRLGCHFVGLQARLQARVWVLALSVLGHKMVANFVFSNVSQTNCE